MDMDITKLIETAKGKLAIRERALKATLAEIELLEAAGAPADALQEARTKRDRQHRTCQASLQLIDALGNSKANVNTLKRSK